MRTSRNFLPSFCIAWSARSCPCMTVDVRVRVVVVLGSAAKKFATRVELQGSAEADMGDAAPPARFAVGLKVDDAFVVQKITSVTDSDGHIITNAIACGDRIVQVDGAQPVSHEALLFGERDSVVELSVRRGNEQRELSVKRNVPIRIWRCWYGTKASKEADETAGSRQHDTVVPDDPPSTMLEVPRGGSDVPGTPLAVMNTPTRLDTPSNTGVSTALPNFSSSATLKAWSRADHAAMATPSPYRSAVAQPSVSAPSPFDALPSSRVKGAVQVSQNQDQSRSAASSPACVASTMMTEANVRRFAALQCGGLQAAETSVMDALRRLKNPVGGLIDFLGDQDRGLSTTLGLTLEEKVVRSVIPSGPAHLEGSVHVGDRIVAIDGEMMDYISDDALFDVLQKGDRVGSTCILTVERVEAYPAMPLHMQNGGPTDMKTWQVQMPRSSRAFVSRAEKTWELMQRHRELLSDTLTLMPHLGGHAVHLQNSMDGSWSTVTQR